MSVAPAFDVNRRRTPSSRGAAVRLAPPPDGTEVAPLARALPFGGLVVAFVLEGIFPLAGRAAWFPTSVRGPVAVVLFLAGLLLFVGGHLALRRAGTGVDARLPALVETWPFSRSRNPMELGVHVMLTGVALALRLYWLLLLLPLLLAMCHYGVMRREENYLEQKFGATYRRYRARVRRWL